MSEKLDTASGEQSATDAVREGLLATFQAGYRVYGAVLDAKNGSGESGPIAPAGLMTAERQLEAFLTPGLVAAAEADLAVHETDGNAGFDVIILPDTNFTADEETAVAGALQAVLGRLPNSWGGDPNVDDAYHNAGTAYLALGTDQGIRFALAPRHANIPAADAKAQKAWLEARQSQGVEYGLRTPTDLEAMAHILVLAEAGALDDLSSRFDRTYSRRVEAYQEDEHGAPIDEHIPNVGVHENGQLSRGSSRVASASNPGRAVVV